MLKFWAMPTVPEVTGEIERLRDELAGILREPSESVREERIVMWADRVYGKLKSWGFSTHAEKVGGRNSILRMYEGVNVRAKMRDDVLLALRSELHEHPKEYEAQLSRGDLPNSPAASPMRMEPQKIFLGHGRNVLWARVQLHLKDELRLAVEAWESDSRAGHHSVDVLKRFLSSSSFAVILATGEDLTANGAVRARQNVVHEVGLFQGRLGFEKVALLEQEGVEGFSNIAGLQVIRFPGERIEAAFYDLDRMLKREGIIGASAASP
jgi:predicted nucleotide-binding protein